jgi:O-antigen/teichoic acid export membrane protein
MNTPESTRPTGEEQNRRDLRIFAKGAGVSLFGYGIGRGFHALNQIITARLLGPAAFGLFGIGWTILQVVIAFSTLGLHHGVVRFGSMERNSDRVLLKAILQQSLSFTFLASTAAGVILFILTPWLANDIYHKPELIITFRIIAFAIPFMAGLRVAAAATRISQNMVYSTVTEDIGRPAISLILFIGFFVLGYRLIGALWALTISAVIAFLWALAYLARLYPGSLLLPLDLRSNWKELLIFSIPTALTGLFTYFGNQLDRIFVGIYLKSSDMGVYEAMAQVSILFVIVLRAFNGIFAPMIADLYQKGEVIRLERIYRISTKWALYISMPIFLIILIIPGNLMQVVFGGDYRTDTLPLVILAAGQLVNVGTGAVGYLLIMTGRQNRWLVYSFLMVVVSIVSSIKLIPAWGLIGAAISSSIAVILVFSLGLLDVYRSLRLWPYDHRFVKGIGAFLSAGIAGWLISNLDIGNYTLKLLVVGVAVGVVFVVVLLMLGFDDEDYEVFQILRRKLGKK